MRLKFPCRKCTKSCKNNQNSIFCNICNSWIHTKCTSLTLAQFNDLAKEGENVPYFCMECIKENIPFQCLDSLSQIDINNDQVDESDQILHKTAGEKYLKNTYHNIDFLNQKLEKRGNDELFIMHFNARSLSKNIEEIQSLIAIIKDSPDIICISETKLHDDKIDWQSNLVKLPGYALVYNNSTTQAGGVGIYVSEKLKFCVKHELNLNVSNCESLFIELNLNNEANKQNGGNKNILVGCAYRHPKVQTEAFVNEFCEKLGSFASKNIPIIVLGDINIDLSKPNDIRVQNYVNMVTSLGCHNLITAHTRFEENCRSTLDHIVTNFHDNKISSGILNYTITDHLPIYALAKTGTRHSEKNDNTQNCRFYQKLTDSKKETFIATLEKNLTNIDLNKQPDDILSALTLATKKSIDQCFPPKRISNRRRKKELKPWINRDIVRQIKMQNKLFRKFLKTNDPADHKNYKCFRNKLNKSKNKAKREYFHDKLKKASDNRNSKMTWDVINHVLKNDKCKVVPEVVTLSKDNNRSVNNQNTTSSNGKSPTTNCPKSIANILNQHFTGIGKKLAKKLEKSKYKFSAFMGKRNVNSIFLKEIEISEIYDEIRSLCTSKVAGYDKISPKVLKWSPHLFAPILHVAYNKCIRQGRYPSNLKIAKVSPIHKGGDKNDIDNYRPISVLTQFNRILERLIAKRLVSFFERFNIISKKQFGFQKRHNTEHAILDLKEYILSNMDKKETTAVLFLDLKKAFDTVNHEILLQKLEYYGIRGVAHQLISSYLLNRVQYTVVDNYESDLASILWGVPQGSVLGPLLFLIYINDLPNSCDMSTWLFADDTALAVSSKHHKVLEEKLNIEANSVQNWLLANKLSIHYVKKTQYMLFTPNNKNNHNLNGFKLYMAENYIERTNAYKYLGVIIDEKLDWKPQISQLCQKLASVCGVISKVRYYLNSKSLMLLYHSLVASRIRYGILCWSTASKYDLKKLDVLHNRVVRYITFSPYRTTLKPLYVKLDVLPLSELIDMQRALFMYNLHYNLLPYAFENYCSIPSHRYATSYSRSKNYTLPPYKSNRGQTSMKFLGPKIWARIPLEIKELNSRKQFVKKTKKYFL